MSNTYLEVNNYWTPLQQEEDEEEEENQHDTYNQNNTKRQ